VNRSLASLLPVKLRPAANAITRSAVPMVNSTGEGMAGIRRAVAVVDVKKQGEWRRRPRAARRVWRKTSIGGCPVAEQWRAICQRRHVFAERLPQRVVVGRWRRTGRPSGVTTQEVPMRSHSVRNVAARMFWLTRHRMQERYPAVGRLFVAPSSLQSPAPVFTPAEDQRLMVE